VADRPPRPELAGLSIGDSPEAWAALGFTVVDETVVLGGVPLALGGAAAGIVAWSLTGIDPSASLDGLTLTAPGALTPEDPPAHPNGAVGIDHVVALTPDFDRTCDAFTTAGLELRRVRTVGSGPDAFRQGFRRLGPAIIELVEGRRLPPGPARFWGLTLIVADIDGLAARLGPELVSAPKPAVQPGRRICTLRAAAGLAQAVAFMDPESR
jgi:catechol 2,3-dioxygenase-like lactoylglutathione lyase family enzyme